MPLGALPWLDSHQEDSVNLFQALTACFGEEKEHHSDGDQVACREEIPVGKSDVGCDEWGCKADEEVEH